ncbi:hypothetical protein ACQEVC_42415 [Plantactinospora sp. CA-294935]|uniref:hypothetical protein n=1 Tax=Plantactinospora sp. CA-294935 TaxID=3240012 RepID=UPI003D90A5A9
MRERRAVQVEKDSLMLTAIASALIGRQSAADLPKRQEPQVRLEYRMTLLVRESPATCGHPPGQAARTVGEGVAEGRAVLAQQRLAAWRAASSGELRRSQGRELHGPRPGCPDDRHGPAEKVAAQLRTSFCEAAVDEADRSRVVTRFKSILQPGGQDRGEHGVKTVRPSFAEGLGGLVRW